jgi:hypothetical protein
LPATKAKLLATKHEQRTRKRHAQKKTRCGVQRGDNVAW